MLKQPPWGSDDARGLPRANASEMPEAMPEGGVWYQPRSLWSVLFVATALSNYVDFPFTFKRKHFRNGTRWPITLNRMSICPVNYPIAYQDNDGAGVPNPYNPISYAMSVLKGASIRVSSPYRKAYSRQEIAVGSHPALPTWQPHGATGYDSSLFGVSYLKFDKPMIVPRESNLMVQSGGMSAVAFRPAEGVDVQFVSSPIYSTYFFNEAGGMFSGAQRYQRGVLEQDFPNINPIPDLDTGYPFGLPGHYVYIPGAPGVTNWPPQAKLDPSTFDRQENSRSGSSMFYGMGIAVDQVLYDDAAAIFAAGEGWDTTGGGFRLSALSTRLGCRARMAKGVNTDWWWRPGAPMALVLDTITPALVYELPEPITLGPGESLNVEGRFPGIEYFGNTQGDDDEKQFQVGISFNGFTAIEG